MTPTRTLQDVFIDELRAVYYAEHQIATTLPKLIAGTASGELRRVLEMHLEETLRQIDRIEQAFRMLDEMPGSEAQHAMVSGILEQGRREALDERLAGPVRDAALIAAIQRVEHYETASYGTLAAWASSMGREEVASLLRDSLGETKDANWKLSRLASDTINPAALSATAEK